MNYVYGTWLVLCGLQSIGEDMNQPYIRKAVDWLTAHQNEDGGWGETCASYLNPKLRGQGTSTPSQTAWAVMALVEAGATHSAAAQRGIDFLIRHQQNDGSWQEDHFTGTVSRTNRVKRSVLLNSLPKYCPSPKSRRGLKSRRISNSDTVNPPSSNIWVVGTLFSRF